MTPKEILLQVIEAADDNLIADLLAWLTERRFSPVKAPDGSLAFQVGAVETDADVRDRERETNQDCSIAAGDGLRSGNSFVSFFRSSPLCDVVDEIDLSRDQSPVPDRIFL